MSLMIWRNSGGQYRDLDEKGLLYLFRLDAETADGLHVGELR